MNAIATFLRRVQQGIHYSYSNECSVVVLCISFRWHYPHTGWPPWLHQRVLTLTATLTCSLDDRWHTRQGSRCYTPHTTLCQIWEIRSLANQWSFSLQKEEHSPRYHPEPRPASGLPHSRRRKTPPGTTQSLAQPVVPVA